MQRCSLYLPQKAVIFRNIGKCRLFFIHTKSIGYEHPGKKRPKPVPSITNPRREFLRTGAFVGTLAGMTGLGLISSCAKGAEEDGISPVEDLMREHGVLNRIMMIYDHCRARLVNKEELQIDSLRNSAGLIRSFVEDYHEKLEEKFLFSPLCKRE